MGVCLYHIHNPAEKTNNAQHNFPLPYTHTHTHFLLPVLPPFRTPVWIHPVPSGGRRRGDLRRLHWDGQWRASGSNVPRVKATGQCAHLGRPVKKFGTGSPLRAFRVWRAWGTRRGMRGGAREGGGLSVPAQCLFCGGGGCYNGYIKRRSLGGGMGGGGPGPSG